MLPIKTSMVLIEVWLPWSVIKNPTSVGVVTLGISPQYLELQRISDAKVCIIFTNRLFWWTRTGKSILNPWRSVIGFLYLVYIQIRFRVNVRASSALMPMVQKNETIWTEGALIPSYTSLALEKAAIRLKRRIPGPGIESPSAISAKRCPKDKSLLVWKAVWK